MQRSWGDKNGFGKTEKQQDQCGWTIKREKNDLLHDIGEKQGENYLRAKGLWKQDLDSILRIMERLWRLLKIGTYFF